MYLSVLIFGLVLLPQVHNLECSDCLEGSGPCTNSTCLSEDFQCGAMRTMSSAGSMELADITVKSCMLAEQCGVISVNFGMAKTVVHTKCCETDLCNNALAPEIPATSPNGKKCFTCEGLKCTSILNCEGNEDYCITASVDMGGTAHSVKGCGSKQLCTEGRGRMGDTFGSNMKCCEGDLCNSARNIAAGLLPVMTSLSLVLFS